MQTWSPAPGVEYHLWYEPGAGWVSRCVVKNYGGVRVATALLPLAETELLACVRIISDWVFVRSNMKEGHHGQAVQRG
jgi:hypothetical protein